MDYRYVRVFADDLDNPSAPLVLDVLLDADGKFKDNVPYLGWWGSHKSTEVYPFIAKNIDGTYMIDFGSDALTVQADRYITLSLMHGAIEIGKRFKTQYDGDWYSFRVSRVVDLVAARDLE